MPRLPAVLAIALNAAYKVNRESSPSRVSQSELFAPRNSIMLSKTSSLALLAAIPSIYAASYNLADNYVGSNFFNTWSWQAIADPTHGRV
jgi:hypothetical protein